MQMRWVVIVGLTAMGCGDSASRPHVDAAPPDAAPPDAAPPDAAPPDAAPPDAAPPDAAPPDAAPPDAAPPDAASPDAGPPDAAPPDAGPPDAAPPDAASPDAAPGPPCTVEATFAVAAPGAATALAAVPITGGWLFAYDAGGASWWTVHDDGGTVRVPPTSLGQASGRVMVRGADRVLLVVDRTVHAIDLDGTMRSATTDLPRAPEVLVAGPGTGFRAVTTLVVPPEPWLGESELDATVYTLDRDGVTTATLAPQRLPALSLWGGVPAPGGGTLIGATLHAAVGGCMVCTSDGFVTMNDSGLFGQVVSLPRQSFEAAFATGIAVAGDRVYVGAVIINELDMHIRSEWRRLSLATIEEISGAGEPLPRITPLGTGFRTGVRALWGRDTPPTIQAFTDDAAVALGATCGLPAVPTGLIAVDADTIAVLGDGQMWLVTSP